ncbi:hypothetical protein [Neorhizobium sp. IRS_2294]|uniref:hypothetical protein n=1 Tax=unclassified Neorhizobium TaxID=2629175 RepID=UPI003D2AFE7A
MFNNTRVMSDYLANLADLDTYAYQTMTIEGLRDEFQVFPVYDDEFEELMKI